MLRGKIWFCAVTSLAVSATAMAGAMSSGGGVQLNDSVNPWFLQNTAEIRYCVDLDPQRFHLDVVTVDAKIHAAYVELPGFSGAIC